MSEALDDLASKAPTLGPLTEYHGNELFGGTGEWAGVFPRQRIDEYGKALAVLRQVDAAVAYASVNKPKLQPN